jgi:hypothetical protein
MTSLRRLEELRLDARYDRERLDLYRAKVYGPGPTSPVRLKALERTCVLSEARLRRAKQEHEAETIRLQARADVMKREQRIGRPGS